MACAAGESASCRRHRGVRGCAKSPQGERATTSGRFINLVFRFRRTPSRAGRNRAGCRASPASAGHSAASASPGRRSRTPRRPCRARSRASARALARSSGRQIDRVEQRRGRRIVDRADQAGDVARGRRLPPALRERRPRLALEIEDVGVVLDDQHLAEMEVAVMADLQRRRCFGGSSCGCARRSPARLRAGDRPSGRRLVQSRRLAGAGRRCWALRSTRRSVQAAMSARADRFGREIRQCRAGWRARFAVRPVRAPIWRMRCR